MIYKILDKFFQNDFSEEINSRIDKSKQKIVVFDIGCFIGNFSKKIKKILTNKNIEFYLFDPNPNLNIDGFKYKNIALSNKKGSFDYHLNTFFPSSGSSLKTIIRDDWLWNLTRKIVTFSFFKSFKTFKVKVDLLDNFCRENKINNIDILKIDVEGSEIDVLEGADEILEKTNIIQIEIFDKKEMYEDKLKKIKTILIKKNFDLIKIKSTWSSQQFSGTKAGDALFVKKNEI